MAGQLGYPVVMKIASPDVLHKSDAGGVFLDLKSPADIAPAYAQIIENVTVAFPQARIEGVHLQTQVPAAQEVIVGMARDPLFGPLMMFGSGGVEVEGLHDVSFALAPLGEQEAREMISSTWAGKKLKGFRNIPPADETAAIDILIKLSRLAVENPDVEEIEINPLRVRAAGAIAVDVRLKRNQPVPPQIGSSPGVLDSEE
jgi:acyl-CoA synthetase (NDP forming)